MFQRMLDVEAALARVQGRSASSRPMRPRRSRRRPMSRISTPRNSPPARAMSAIPSSALVDGLSTRRGRGGGVDPLGRHDAGHRGYRASVLQVRDGLALIRAELNAIVPALAAQADRAPPNGDGRTHPSATGAADHVRAEMRRLGRR